MNKTETRKFLRGMGYRYSIMVNKDKKEFWATKEKMLPNGDFDDNSDWDCFSLGIDDSYVSDKYGVPIKL